MDGRCQDEYLHCTSPGLAEKRMNITYRWIRHHTFGCPLAAGVLRSLPACAQGSSVLGPGSWDSSVPELVFLGLLVVLFCGLLIGLARLAFCRTRFGCPSLLFWQFCPLGVNCLLVLEDLAVLAAILGTQGMDRRCWSFFFFLILAFGCLVCKPGGDCSVSLAVTHAW